MKSPPLASLLPLLPSPLPALVPFAPPPQPPEQQWTGCPEGHGILRHKEAEFSTSQQLSH